MSSIDRIITATQPPVEYETVCDAEVCGYLAPHAISKILRDLAWYIKIGHNPPQAIEDNLKRCIKVESDLDPERSLSEQTKQAIWQYVQFRRPFQDETKKSLRQWATLNETKQTLLQCVKGLQSLPETTQEAVDKANDLNLIPTPVLHSIDEYIYARSCPFGEAELKSMLRDIRLLEIPQTLEESKRESLKEFKRDIFMRCKRQIPLQEEERRNIRDYINNNLIHPKEVRVALEEYMQWDPEAIQFTIANIIEQWNIPEVPYQNRSENLRQSTAPNETSLKETKQTILECIKWLQSLPEPTKKTVREAIQCNLIPSDVQQAIYEYIGARSFPFEIAEHKRIQKAIELWKIPQILDKTELASLEEFKREILLRCRYKVPFQKEERENISDYIDRDLIQPQEVKLALEKYMQWDPEAIQSTTKNIIEQWQIPRVLHQSTPSPTPSNEQGQMMSQQGLKETIIACLQGQMYIEDQTKQVIRNYVKQGLLPQEIENSLLRYEAEWENISQEAIDEIMKQVWEWEIPGAAHQSTSSPILEQVKINSVHNLTSLQTFKDTLISELSTPSFFSDSTQQQLQKYLEEGLIQPLETQQALEIYLQYGRKNITREVQSETLDHVKNLNVWPEQYNDLIDENLCPINYNKFL